jgi:hypothetical protein
MKRFVQGDNRTQSFLLPEALDDYVTDTHPVRVVDVFVDELDLQKLGFEGVEPALTGRPSYHPEVILKIYEDRGDKIIDLHVWRVGPGYMSALVSVATSESQRDSRFYHAVLKRFKGLSHITVEVQPS